MIQLHHKLIMDKKQVDILTSSVHKIMEQDPKYRMINMSPKLTTLQEYKKILIQETHLLWIWI